jgi:hypothetical protein
VAAGEECGDVAMQRAKVILSLRLRVDALVLSGAGAIVRD